VSVTLRGLHYVADDEGCASLVCRAENTEGGESFQFPLDAVRADIAARSQLHLLKGAANAYGCEDPDGSDACGKCERCRMALCDELSMSLLDSAILPDCEFARKLSDAVWEMTGRWVLDTPWAADIDDKRIAQLFEQLGVKEEA
jgi:hypothetical protein